MPRHRRPSTISASSRSTETDAPTGHGQEMGSMYDYLAKVILLGPSGSGKSCLLHRFIKGEWRVLTSQTIGVEFASKIVKIGTRGQGQRKRVKLQLWDTAGTERFRSVSRSYYRGAAGAILVYDVSNHTDFTQLQTFLNDARALASPNLSLVLAGNKTDLADPGFESNLLDLEPSSVPSTRSSTFGPGLGSQQRATTSPAGREVPSSVIANWASQNGIPTTTEVSALSGEGVDDVFNKLARTILTKIELGEIDPNDPMSGIQYGDADYYRFDDGASTKSGRTSEYYGSTRRRRKPGGLREWGDVFRVGQSSGSGAKCC